jgi:hypothetical protein
MSEFEIGYVMRRAATSGCPSRSKRALPQASGGRNEIPRGATNILHVGSEHWPPSAMIGPAEVEETRDDRSSITDPLSASLERGGHATFQRLWNGRLKDILYDG